MIAQVLSMFTDATPVITVLPMLLWNVFSYKLYVPWVMVLNVYCYGSSVPGMQWWPINVCWINQNMITWMHKEGSQENKNGWESSWALRTPWGPCASGSDGGIWLSNLEEAVLKALLPLACITDSTCPISQDPQGFLCEHLPSHWVRNRNGNNNHK